MSTCTLIFLEVSVVLEGNEGGGNSVSLLHVELLGLVPVDSHLGELVKGLYLENVNTSDGRQRVLGVLLCLGCLLNFVLLVRLLLGVRGGSEGCVVSVLLHHGDLLSHSSLQAHRHDNPLKLCLGLCFLRNA